MAIERTYHCDGPGCDCHATTAESSRMAMGFLKITGDGPVKHFCSWDCVLKFAAKFEPTEIIPVGSNSDSSR